MIISKMIIYTIDKLGEIIHFPIPAKLTNFFMQDQWPFRVL